eukprot:80501-Rhodomonas_salina.5
MSSAGPAPTQCPVLAYHIVPCGVQYLHIVWWRAVCSAVCSTDIAYEGVRARYWASVCHYALAMRCPVLTLLSYAVCGTGLVLLRSRYAMSGTDVAFCTATVCAVLRSRMPYCARVCSMPCVYALCHAPYWHSVWSCAHVTCCTAIAYGGGGHVRCAVLTSRMVLSHARYWHGVWWRATSGTEIAYGQTVKYLHSLTVYFDVRIPFCSCYALSGTGIRVPACPCYAVTYAYFGTRENYYMHVLKANSPDPTQVSSYTYCLRACYTVSGTCYALFGTDSGVPLLPGSRVLRSNVLLKPVPGQRHGAHRYLHD